MFIYIAVLVKAYLLVSLKKIDDDWTPEIPEAEGMLLLAEPSRQSHFALYRVTLYLDEMPEILRDMRIETELECLIESGEASPPALALAREDMFSIFRDKVPSPEEFLSAYKRVLRYHLARQKEDGFALVEGLFDEYGNRLIGSFCWARRFINEQDIVEWVTPDYYLKRHPVCQFKMMD